MGGDRRLETLEAQAAELPGWLEDEPDLFFARDRVAAGRCRRRDLGDGRRAPARAPWNHAQRKTVVAAAQTGAEGRRLGNPLSAYRADAS